MMDFKVTIKSEKEDIKFQEKFFKAGGVSVLENLEWSGVSKHYLIPSNNLILFPSNNLVLSRITFLFRVSNYKLLSYKKAMRMLDNEIKKNFKVGDKVHVLRKHGSKLVRLDGGKLRRDIKSAIEKVDDEIKELKIDPEIKSELRKQFKEKIKEVTGVDHKTLYPIEDLKAGDKVVLTVKGGCEFLNVGDTVIVTASYGDKYTPFFDAFVTDENGTIERKFDSRYFEKEVRENEKETT